MESEHWWQAVIFQRRLLRDNNTESYSSGDGDGDDESELDTNMVIILAFLLCALVLTLGLNAFARRGIFSRSTVAAPGLKKCALGHLPMAIYGSGPGNECSICLGDFEDGERIRVLPKCGHGFHVGCIDTWLISHASCPNCRISLLPPTHISTQL